MDKLNQPGHFTLFAPTNDAFNKLSPGYMERIMADKDVIAGIKFKESKSLPKIFSRFFSLLTFIVFTLPALVNYHLLNSVQCSEAIMAGMEYETAEGSSIQIGCDGDSLTVNGIKMVLKKDIVTSNGVIHIIDQVLVPNSGKTYSVLNHGAVILHGATRGGSVWNYCLPARRWLIYILCPSGLRFYAYICKYSSFQIVPVAGCCLCRELSTFPTFLVLDFCQGGVFCTASCLDPKLGFGGFFSVSQMC